MKKDASLSMFYLFTVSQMVSGFGSYMTAFATTVYDKICGFWLIVLRWVYEHTGSITQFSFNKFLVLLPGIFVAPIAGVVVDRYDRCVEVSDIFSVFFVDNVGEAVFLASAKVALNLLVRFCRCRARGPTAEEVFKDTVRVSRVGNRCFSGIFEQLWRSLIRGSVPRNLLLASC